MELSYIKTSSKAQVSSIISRVLHTFIKLSPIRKKEIDTANQGTAAYYPFGRKNIRNFQIHGPLRDTSVFGTVASSGTFEPHIIKVIQKLVKGTDIICDIGANIGALTCIFSHLAPKGKVFAFEASETALKFLNHNIKHNRLRNVKASHIAIADTTGSEIAINVTDEFLGGAFFSTELISDGRKEIVKTIRLDDWVAKQRISRIDFIKMDIEGAEIFALLGAHKTINRMRPFLLIECNAIALQRFHKKSPNDIFTILSQYYDHIYIIPDTEIDGATIIPIKNADQLLLSLRYGRGNDDLICSEREITEVPTIDFEYYLDRIKLLNHGREIVLAPDWQIRFRNEHFTAQPGATITVPVILRNPGLETWADWKTNPVNLSYHIVSNEGVVVFDGERTPLIDPLLPHSEQSIFAKVIAPESKGSYQVHFSPVQEGITWFDKMRPHVAAISLDVL